MRILPNIKLSMATKKPRIASAVLDGHFEEAVQQDVIMEEPQAKPDTKLLLQIFRSSPDKELACDVLSKDDIRNLLKEYKALWVGERGGEYVTNPDEQIKLAITRLEITDPKTKSLKTIRDLEGCDVEQGYKLELFRWTTLQQIFRFNNLLDTGEENTALSSSAESRDNANAFKHIMEAILASRFLLHSMIKVLRLQDTDQDLTISGPLDAFQYTPMDLMAKLSGFHELVIFCFKELQRYGYQRFRGALWEPIYVPVVDHRPVHSHAWKPVTQFPEINDFINEIITKESHFKQWQNLTSQGMRNALLDHLQKCSDHEFHDLIPDRKYFSYRNGILYTRSAKFFPYVVKNGQRQIPNTEIKPTWTSCNYFDVDFDPGWPTLEKCFEFFPPPKVGRCSEDEFKDITRQIYWHKLLDCFTENNLKTTSFDNIFHTQFYPHKIICHIQEQMSKANPKLFFKKPSMDDQSGYWTSAELINSPFYFLESEARKDLPDLFLHGVTAWQVLEYDHILIWHYALLGRLLFKVGELDNWQVIQFFKGVAGAGKSTLLNLAGSFFRREDVETMGNTGTRGGGKGVGGLENFLDKMLWRVYEIKSDFGLDQSTFQSMVSGEVVAIDRLYKSSLSKKWDVPGILAGNDFGGWKDNSGSVLRRVLVTVFALMIPADKKNPDLERELEAELPRLLYKCLTCYLLMVRQYKKVDIWNVLPNYFVWTRSRLAAASDPLGNYINNNLMNYVQGNDKYMLWDKFLQDVTAWAEANDVPKRSITMYKDDIDKAVPVLKAKGITIMRAETKETQEEYKKLIAPDKPSVGKFYILRGICKIEEE